MKIKTSKKFYISIISFLLLVIFSLGTIASAKEISPAIDILRSKTTFTKCALLGSETSFSKEDFEAVVGCSFDYVTITKTPSSETGVLKVSGVDVIDGQSIISESLDLLKFVPTSKETENNPSFTFTVSDKSWKSTDIVCNINYLSSINYAPVAESFRINTVKNISAYSEINVYDPDNDEMTIKVSSYPSFGSIAINTALKRVTYTPEKNFTGNDVFTVYAEDKYGNKSNTANVYVTVDSDSGNMTFGDMGESDLHFAAIALSKNNIMTYSKKGGEYYFSPDEEVNKIDFTVMLLCASRLNDGISSVKDTEFIDDKELSSGRKSYLKRALDVEIVEIGDRYFKPDEIIKTNEARSMVAKSLGLDFESETVDLIMGNSVSKTSLTKEDVAEILYNICIYLN